MRKVKFKNYIGTTKTGEPAVYDCADYHERDLIEMLRQPLHLQKVCFKVGHAIWTHHMSDLFNDPGDPKIVACSAWMNLGLVRALASIGFRIVPTPDEIEIF